MTEPTNKKEPDVIGAVTAAAEGSFISYCTQEKWVSERGARPRKVPARRGSRRGKTRRRPSMTEFMKERDGERRREREREGESGEKERDRAPP